ncbi:MAG TPA: PKD domain-containing protein [Flavipsychrobacter sp.]
MVRKLISVLSLLVVTNPVWAQPCNVNFQATADDPVCSGKDIQLDATLIPGAVYTWTPPAVPPPTWSPSSNVRDPKLLNISPLQSGTYTVTATIGPCVYQATVNINVTPTPDLGNVVQAGPVCPGEDDTISLPTINAPVGATAYIFNASLNDVFDGNYNYFMNDVQKQQAGFYFIYAETPNGCRSDTAAFEFKVNPDVYPDFSFEIKEDCEEDEVIFTNLTTSDDNLGYISNWNFGDGTPSQNITDGIHTHFYKVPVPNYTDRTYKVVLIADNGKCKDTVDKDVYINHPVKAEFVADDDSICQGETINFKASDGSFVKPGTVPQMLWKFGDGATDIIIDTKHTYERSGKYEATFIITDFLGCSDSFKVPVIVDSLGHVIVQADKTEVCVGEEMIFTVDYFREALNSANWSFGDGVVIPDVNKVHHSYSQPGTYNVRFDVDYRICPDVSYTGEYTVKPIPVVYLGEDTAICPDGEPVYIADLFNRNVNPDIKYTWSTPDRSSSAGILVRYPGVYSVKADLNGCIATDSVEVRKDCYINIPNVFTPNGDGSSDYFLPRQLMSRNISRFNMDIYNRWGQKIFETNANDGRGWDGRYKGEIQPVGVYVYTIQVTFGNGTTERYTGNVTLLR